MSGEVDMLVWSSVACFAGGSYLLMAATEWEPLIVGTVLITLSFMHAMGAWQVYTREGEDLPPVGGRDS